MAEQQDVLSNIAIVDGSNVAHANEAGAQLQNIHLVWEKLVEQGYEPIVVSDAALRHQIDDKRRYEQLIDEGRIKQAPAGTDADYFILSFARELAASIVSNDRFKDRMNGFPDAQERLIKYMILNNEVVFERRTSRR